MSPLVSLALFGREPDGREDLVEGLALVRRGRPYPGQGWRRRSGRGAEAQSSTTRRIASEIPMPSRRARASSACNWRLARRTATSFPFGSLVGRPPGIGFVIHNWRQPGEPGHAVSGKASCSPCLRSNSAGDT
jgi:hypothetical protein